MRKLILGLTIIVAVAAPATSASAWWDEGHMQIAAVAYKNLTGPVKDRVDVLLRFNKDYVKWTAGAPDEVTAKQWAFVHAATWADDIKMKSYGYARDSATSETAGQNVGYADHNQHDYWHYKDVGFSPDSTPLVPPNAVDAVTQLRLMIATLPASSGASDELRSYDLVWILHLVGDVHQPLHAITRFTKELPNGDRGGNLEMLIPATGETVTLHAYWDRMFGGYSSAFGAIFDADRQNGIANLDPNPEMAKILDPARWIEESVELAKTYAYAAPVSTGSNATLLTREYETGARNVALSQAALAAARLANLLNTMLQ